MIIKGNTSNKTDTGSGDTTAFDSGSAGVNRILVMGFSNFDATSIAQRSVSSVTYGGVSLTNVANATADNATSNGRCEIWYVINPLQGSNNIAVTFGGTNTITNSQYFYAVFYNVDLTAPIATSGNHTTVAGTQDRITLTTVQTGEMLVDVNNGNAGPMTLGTGQTSLMDLGGSTGRGSYLWAGSAGNYNMDMNRAVNDDFAHGAISLKPAVGKQILVGPSGGVTLRPKIFTPGIAR